MQVQVEVVHDASEVIEAFRALLPQLSKSAPPLDEEHLVSVLTCPTNTVFLVRRDGAVVGTLTLVVFPVLTGVRATIEDVVVDEAARGQGVSAALTQAAPDLARARGAKTVDLTSRPSREAAHRLYSGSGSRFATRKSTKSLPGST